MKWQRQRAWRGDPVRHRFVARYGPTGGYVGSVYQPRFRAPHPVRDATDIVEGMTPRERALLIEACEALR